MQKIDCLKAIALNLGDLVVDSTPATLTGSSIDIASLIHPISGQLKGAHAYCYGPGPAAGQSRICTDFTPANNRMEFAQVFTTSPSTNSNFIVTKFWGYDHYDNAIDRMMGIARLHYLEEKVATLAIVATQYEYPVPSGFEFIGLIRLVPSSNTDYGADDEVNRVFELGHQYWQIKPTPGGSFVIAFDSRKINLDNFDNQLMEIIGQLKPAALGTDNAELNEDLEEYVIAGASALLAAQRISGSDNNREWYYRFRTFSDDKKALEDYIHRSRYGRQVG